MTASKATTGAAADVKVGRISMVILYVKDPMRSLPFYRDLLGMKVLEASPHWAEFDGGGVHLAVHPHPDVPAKREETRSWVVFETSDIHGTYEAFRAKGLSFACAPKQVCGDEKSVGLSADFEDPDGNRFSLFGFVPRAP